MLHHSLNSVKIYRVALFRVDILKAIRMKVPLLIMSKRWSSHDPSSYLVISLVLKFIIHTLRRGNLKSIY